VFWGLSFTCFLGDLLVFYMHQQSRCLSGNLCDSTCIYVFSQLIVGMYFDITDYGVFFRCCSLISGEETDTEQVQPDE